MPRCNHATNIAEESSALNVSSTEPVAADFFVPRGSLHDIPSNSTSSTCGDRGVLEILKFPAYRFAHTVNKSRDCWIDTNRRNVFLCVRKIGPSNFAPVDVLVRARRSVSNIWIPRLVVLQRFEAISVCGLGTSSRYDKWIGPKVWKLIARIERERRN